MNARLELLKEPEKDTATLATLDFAASFSNGDRALLQAVLLFLQEDVGKPRQGPEAQDGGGTHHLIVVQAQFLFAVAEKHLDVPACSDMGEQGLGVAFQITGGPEPCLGERGIQRKWRTITTRPRFASSTEVVMIRILAFMMSDGAPLCHLLLS